MTDQKTAEQRAKEIWDIMESRYNRALEDCPEDGKLLFVPERLDFVPISADDEGEEQEEYPDSCFCYPGDPDWFWHACQHYAAFKLEAPAARYIDKLLALAQLRNLPMDQRTRSEIQQQYEDELEQIAAESAA